MCRENQDQMDAVLEWVLMCNQTQKNGKDQDLFI